jgi:hypothetical protein
MKFEGVAVYRDPFFVVAGTYRERTKTLSERWFSVVLDQRMLGALFRECSSKPIPPAMCWFTSPLRGWRSLKGLIGATSSPSSVRNPSVWVPGETT